MFGAGGDRDRAKRPLMGRVAGEFADVVVITSDNPRDERPLAIIEAVASGAEGVGPVLVDVDRARAITGALQTARAGDVVLIAGKGHETGQDFGTHVEHFDDVAGGPGSSAAPAVRGGAGAGQPGAGRGQMKALLIAGGVALLVAILGTPLLISQLRARGIGQQIREDGPAGHFSKAGTPTMGGLAIMGATVAGYIVAHVSATFTTRGLVGMLTICGAAFVGLLDDWLKVTRQRSLGLNKRAKIEYVKTQPKKKNVLLADARRAAH